MGGFFLVLRTVYITRKTKCSPQTSPDGGGEFARGPHRSNLDL
jgi:hypothetical protein